MNRIIKFRGKSVIDKKWMYGSFVLCTHNAIADICDIVADNNDTTQTPVLSYTVGQFTGLLDKNGKEIYEGDIVEVLDTRMAVTYVNSSFRLRECTLACYDTKSIEVIGNVFDNPEMIKKEV